MREVAAKSCAPPHPTQQVHALALATQHFLLCQACIIITFCQAASHAVSNGFVNFSIEAQRSSKESLLKGAAHFGPEVGLAAELLKAGRRILAGDHRGGGGGAETPAPPPPVGRSGPVIIALAKFAMGSTSFRQGHWIPRGGAGFRPDVSQVDNLVEFAASALADPQLPQPVQLGGFFWLQVKKGALFLRRGATWQLVSLSP